MRARGPADTGGSPCAQRFGRAVQVWIALLMLLNMGIAMTAEYTAVGDLFELVVGTTRVPIVVIIGVVSALYTAYGGLYVSIITDQWQACRSCPHWRAAAVYLFWDLPSREDCAGC